MAAVRILIDQPTGEYEYRCECGFRDWAGPHTLTEFAASAKSYPIGECPKCGERFIDAGDLHDIELIE